MRRSLLSAVAVLAGLSLSVASADEVIHIKGAAKPFKTSITRESAQGVSATGKDIPAEDILDIEYELNPLLVRTGIYRKARDADKDAQEKEAGRKGNIAAALKLYEEALAKMAPKQ